MHKIYKWKEYVQGIKILPKHSKDKKKAKQLTDLLQYILSKTKQGEICMRHIINYCVCDCYRLYRRGKNRCKYCGVKIE